MTPKTFKLVELAIGELFESISKIHTDAFIVWNNLTAAYPPDYFLGCIEDAFGAFFDKESQEKLFLELSLVSDSVRHQIEIDAQRFEDEKHEIYAEFEERDKMFESLKESHVLQLAALEANML